MTEKIINEDYTIDLDSVNTDAHCPYCGGADFIGASDIEIIHPLDDEDPDIGDVDYPNGVYRNTCTKCVENSVWMEGDQYKIVV